MPVYNSERYVARAVKSILDQTFRDFEFLVINDGSTDRSIDIIREFNDPRIRVIDTENQGVAAALRLGMEMARGTYIARMDADDESLPNRLEIEKHCLDAHPEVAVVHGSVQYMRRRNPRRRAPCADCHASRRWPGRRGRAPSSPPPPRFRRDVWVDVHQPDRGAGKRFAAQDVACDVAGEHGAARADEGDRCHVAISNTARTSRLV